MDTVTQIALGAGVGAALLGRRMGPRRAALVGGVLGLLPDLDILVRFDNPVDSMINHRSWSHSLLVHAVLTPVLGEGLMRLSKTLRDQRLLTYAAVFLCLATHALLDVMTIYGTQLWWPVWNKPLGLGSIFIIDPLYSLPLFVIVFWALARGAWTRRFGAVVAFGLIASTAYLGWGAAAQKMIEARAKAMFASAGFTPERMLAIPTPFNSLYWRVIAMNGNHYLNLYLPVLGDESSVSAYMHPSGAELATCLDPDGNQTLARLRGFNHGFQRIDWRDNEIVVSDLRMGLTPNYAFQFAIAERHADGLRSIMPGRRGGSGGAPGDLGWLLANIGLDPVTRPIEAAARLDRTPWTVLAHRAQEMQHC